ncbi:hypothetical protein MTR67_007480 [Solanum verrucosum]|uniref:Uncharacterized protein n=1 Tax=Solanum verrucosum TaxID=315347 RepID=A0AAF0TI87_SOLVR|nr:hypothetical protein MTR67_007480 [Solanum verrucosum]
MAQSRQKSCVDQKVRDLEFMVGERVLLKVSLMKGVMRFGKKGKLSPSRSHSVRRNGDSLGIRKKVYSEINLPFMWDSGDPLETLLEIHSLLGQTEGVVVSLETNVPEAKKGLRGPVLAIHCSNFHYVVPLVNLSVHISGVNIGIGKLTCCLNGIPEDQRVWALEEAMVNVFLRTVNVPFRILVDISDFKEASLAWANDGGQNGFDAVNNDFFHNLVVSVTKSNRPGNLESVGVWSFWDKENEGGVDVEGHKGVFKITYAKFGSRYIVDGNYVIPHSSLDVGDVEEAVIEVLKEIGFKVLEERAKVVAWVFLDPVQYVKETFHFGEDVAKGGVVPVGCFDLEGVDSFINIFVFAVAFLDKTLKG